MEYTRQIERRFAVSPGGELRVSNRRGRVAIQGEDREDVEVTATIRLEAMTRAEAEDRFDAFELPMRETARGVEIGPPRYDEPHPTVLFGISLGRFMRGPRLDLVIRTPRGVEVQAENQTGRVEVSDLAGGVRAASQRGTIAVSDVHGRVRVEGRAGRVEVQRVRGPVEVDARSGRVTVEDVEGAVSVMTSTGRIEVREVRGECRAETRTGKISAVEVDGALTLATKTGALEVRGRIAHDANLRVRTGSITLAVTRDSAFFIDAETRTGSVTADLPVNYLSAPPADAPTVRARAVTGSIRVVPV